MYFPEPYYVSPHSVRRFQERIADIPTRTVREVVMSQLQPGVRRFAGMSRWDRLKMVVYHGQFKEKHFYIPTREETVKTNAWPVVPTILTDDMTVFWDRNKLSRLWASDMTVEEIGRQYGVSQSTVSRWAKRQGLPSKKQKVIPMTDQEKGIMANGIHADLPTSDILISLSPDRPESSYRVHIHRLRKLKQEDIFKFIDILNRYGGDEL